jgi:uncharacterized protein
MSEAQPAPAFGDADSFDVLDGHSYMNLTSFYASGKGVITPVWFARDGDHIYVTTQDSSYKAKRIRATGRVEIGPSDARGKPLGPVVRAQARVLDEAGEKAAIDAGTALLVKKYGLLFRLFALGARLRGARRAFLQITPAEITPA